jgi:hypothetical protein
LAFFRAGAVVRPRRGAVAPGRTTVNNISLDSRATPHKRSSVGSSRAFISLPPQNSEQSRWFAEQVLPHEPMLRAWLRSLFPTEGDIDDIVQDAYIRILRAHAAESPTPSGFPP